MNIKKMMKKVFTGAGAGFLIGGPAGAILGALFAGGTESSETIFGENLEDDHDHLQLIVNFAVLLSLASMRGGMISDKARQHIKTIFQTRFDFENQSMDDLDRLMDEVEQAPLRVGATARQLKTVTTEEERKVACDILKSCIGVDGVPTDDQLRLVQKISRELGVTDNSTGRMFDFNSPDPYKVLGLSAKATDVEVKSAYRSLARHYHPDRVTHMGQEFIDLAHEKLYLVNQAYRAIKNERNL